VQGGHWYGTSVNAGNGRPRHSFLKIQTEKSHLQENGCKFYEMARVAFAVPFRYITSSQISSAISLWERTKDVFSKNWYLGFTAFGGPPVHFQIVSHVTIIQNANGSIIISLGGQV
jgi:hypothetical protein